MNEPALIRLYMDLTASTEAEARSTLMYVCYATLAVTSMDSQSDWQRGFVANGTRSDAAAVPVPNFPWASE
jgi:hypothetical protein